MSRFECSFIYIFRFRLGFRVRCVPSEWLIWELFYFYFYLFFSSSSSSSLYFEINSIVWGFASPIRKVDSWFPFDDFFCCNHHGGLMTHLVSLFSDKVARPTYCHNVPPIIYSLWSVWERRHHLLHLPSIRLSHKIIYSNAIENETA